MDEIEKSFAKLVGEILAKRWIRQKQRTKQNACNNASTPSNLPINDERRKRQEPPDDDANQAQG